MQKNSPINSIYLVALALVTLVGVINSVYTALIFSVVVVGVFLLSISVVSMIEKIADKNIKFFIYSLISVALIIIIKVICNYVNSSIIVITSKVLDIAIVPCMMLAIVPIYLEDNFTTRQFFNKALMISGVSILMFLIYGIIVEVLGYGAFAGKEINVKPIEFITMPSGAFMIVGILCVIFNLVRRHYLKKTRRFNMLVEKYKIQIREIRSTAEREKAQKGGQD